MTSYQSELKDGAYVALVTGMLTVNGVEKEVKLDATMSGDGKVGLKATGTTKLLMTDFGVKPVTALMGTIRTGNEVTVKIDLTGVVAAAVAQLPEK
jgi:polyisoprenoid-binding protein YceI